MKVTRLLLVRHAAVDALHHGRFIGSSDVSASTNGLEEVSRLIPLIDEYSPALCYVSPMLRTVQTKNELQRFSSKKYLFEHDDRLREINFGRWEQKTFQEINQEEPEKLEGWSQYDDFVFPEGESIVSFTGRITELYNDLKQTEASDVLLVTHGGVIRTMICLALKLPVRNYLLFNVQPATLTVLDVFEEGALLSGLNR